MDTKEILEESAGNAELFHEAHEILRIIRQARGPDGERLRAAVAGELARMESELTADAPAPDVVHELLSHMEVCLRDFGGHAALKQQLAQARRDFEQGFARE